MGRGMGRSIEGHRGERAFWDQDGVLGLLFCRRR